MEDNDKLVPVMSKDTSHRLYPILVASNEVKTIAITLAN